MLGVDKKHQTMKVEKMLICLINIHFLFARDFNDEQNVFGQRGYVLILNGVDLDHSDQKVL